MVKLMAIYFPCYSGGMWYYKPESRGEHRIKMSTAVYKHILSTYGKNPGIWAALVCEVIRTLLTRIYMVVVVANLAAAVTAGNMAEARQAILIYVGVMVVSMIAGSAGDLLGHYFENVTYGKLSFAYYTKLTTKDMAFYRDSRSGYVTAMFRQYLDSALLLTRMYRTEVIRMVISLTAPVVVLFAYSWQIGLAALGAVISQAIYMVWASSKANIYRAKSNEIYRAIAGEVTDDITNIVAYKSAGQEKTALQRIRQLRKEEMAAFWQRRKYTILLDIPRNLATALFTAGAFYGVVSGGIGGQASVALLVLTITYMFQITRNVSDLPDIIAKHDDLVTNLEPTLETLTDKHETIRDGKLASFKPKDAAITLKNLYFRYGAQSKRYIFKDFNLDITSGEHIGIVGLSGAGKSTLASLLMRFDDVESGQILIGGVDIRDAAQSKLRRQIAYVPQEPVLFHRSIKENIAYHNAKATDKDIERAAKAAHAYEFIKELPDKFETIVGERGVKLSGGQKQRIVIARAILKNAPIIVFDEATSALDSHSEHIIQQALPDIIGNHTAIIIAHRLSTVAGLDRIIVMHDGVIEEQGTHAQLLKNKGRYYSLWQKQIHRNK